MEFFFKCANCGEMSSASTMPDIGQHLLCPYCETKFNFESKLLVGNTVALPNMNGNATVESTRSLLDVSASEAPTIIIKVPALDLSSSKNQKSEHVPSKQPPLETLTPLWEWPQPPQPQVQEPVDIASEESNTEPTPATVTNEILPSVVAPEPQDTVEVPSEQPPFETLTPPIQPQVQESVDIASEEEPKCEQSSVSTLGSMALCDSTSLSSVRSTAENINSDLTHLEQSEGSTAFGASLPIALSQAEITPLASELFPSLLELKPSAAEITPLPAEITPFGE